MILTPIEAVVGVLMNAVTRDFEYQADRFAVDLQELLRKNNGANAQELEEMRDMGPRLGNALITLHVKNLSTVWVDWL
jgi:STE24 endopeptidase